MPVTTTKTDNLAHIAYDDEHLNHDDPKLLCNQVSSTSGRIVIIGAYGCALVLYYDIGLLTLNVRLVLETPVGSKTLIDATLNPQNPSVTAGGSIDSFKAEATVSFNFGTKVLTAQGQVCAPLLGCKSGQISIHL